jgi:type III pantothenate kinase
MNLCIDQGNSSTKIGIFKDDALVDTRFYTEFNEEDLNYLKQEFEVRNLIISSVTNEDFQSWSSVKSFNEFIFLTHQTLIPIQNKYKSPELLGKDRLAAVIGAAFLRPNDNSLVIDAGTAITYDFIDSSGVYHGGNIAPGISLRFKSLHEHTKKLPLINPSPSSSLPFMGNDTLSAIECGVINGLCFEIDGYIDHLKLKYSQLSTFLTGGSTFYFDTKLKNAIFAESNLVLIGLNRILEYNVQK